VVLYRYTTGLWCHSPRRSDLKYLDLKIRRFSRLSFALTGTPFIHVKPCLKFWGLPRKRVWYVRGLLWKLVWNFGSRNGRAAARGFCLTAAARPLRIILGPISSICGVLRALKCEDLMWCFMGNPTLHEFFTFVFSTDRIWFFYHRIHGSLQKCRDHILCLIQSDATKCDIRF